MRSLPHKITRHKQPKIPSHLKPPMPTPPPPGPNHRIPPPTHPYTASTYTRHADHTAKTSHPESETSYILTLHTDPAHHKTLTALRTQYFPRNLNKLSAHIALFRALPGSHLDAITADISAVVRTHSSFPISTGAVSMLGRTGVAIGADAAGARAIYEALKGKWEGFLSAQDKGFTAHYTIQNKVEERVARRTLEEVRGGFEGSRGRVDGLSLYRYERGYWRHTKDFMFPNATDA